MGWAATGEEDPVIRGHLGPILIVVEVMEQPPRAARAIGRLGAEAITVARPGLELVARYGLMVKGCLQLLVGLLALISALGDPRGRITDAAGALKAMATNPVGRLFLFLLALGLLAYAGFRLVQGLFDPQRRPLEPSTVFYRIGDVLSGAGYLLLGWGAIRLFLGLGRLVTGDERSRELAREALRLPYGPKMLMVLAFVIGSLTILFLARAFVVRDVCGDLRKEEMDPRTCLVAAAMIRIASVLQAILFGTAAWLLFRAATLHDAGSVRGMGGVFRFLVQGQGTTILVGLALGFVIMAGTSFAEARWRRLY